MDFITVDPDIQPRDEYAEEQNWKTLTRLITPKGLRVPFGSRLIPAYGFSNPQLEGVGIYASFDNAEDSSEIGFASDKVTLRPRKVDAGMVVEIERSGTPDVDVAPVRFSLHGTDPADGNETLTRWDFIVDDSFKQVTYARTGGSLMDFVWEKDNGTETELMKLSTAGVLTVLGSTVWTAGNDGAGSGLDADLLDGMNSTAFAAASHTHPSTDITDFAEAVDDRVDALIQDGTGITWAYVDGSNTLTPTVTLAPFDTDDLGEGATNKYYTDEKVDDRVNALLVEGTNITLTYDDTANTLTIDAASGGSDLVWTATPGDTDIASLTDVTIFSQDVTGVAAGDTIIVEGWFHILNNSGAGRVYILNLDFDGTFGCRVQTASLLNSTDLHWRHFKGILTVISSGEAVTMLATEGRATAAQASGASDTEAATYLSARTWETTGTDRTGTQTVTFNIQSASATGTQTLKLRNATIRKVSAS